MSAQVRLMVTDAAWQDIAAVLDRVKHKAGSPLQQSDRMCAAQALGRSRGGLTTTIHVGCIAEDTLVVKDKLRETIERFFAKLQPFRRIATCDETLGSTFLAVIPITASGIIVGSFVNTP